MAAMTNLEQLPVDALERIASYLTPNELSQCCAVSKSWRQIFSDDIFWKRYCIVEHSRYLESAVSHVQPHFIAPNTDNSNLTPVVGWRLRFLREQHLWNNWKLGQYTRDIIEFDCDDSISYNIKVECVSNDFVFLNYTFETEVFDVSQKPKSILRVPFGLVELWENNLYKVVENKLIVIQCNVVQVFDINLVSKSWSFDKAFFFDRPEEFSSKITAETDLDEIFQESSSHIGDDVERVLCGDFLVGIVTEKGALSTPLMHVWNWRTGKKVKEENCVQFFGNKPKGMSIETSENPATEIIVFSENGRKRRFGVYSLNKFQFLACDEVENEKCLIFGRYLAIFNGSDVRFFKLTKDAAITSCNSSFHINRIDCWHAINDKVIIMNQNEAIILNPKSAQCPMEYKCPLDFAVSDFHIIQNRFVIFQDNEEQAREVWEAGKKFEKLFSFPVNGEIFRAGNNTCNKIVLERTNKLIVLNFW